MITLAVEGDQDVILRLRRLPAQMRAALERKVTALTLKLENKVKGEKLSGQVLHVRTGALRRSIFSTIKADAYSVTGRVASSGDVKYAGIHEFGGRTAAHVIEARKASVLAFVAGGKTIFRRRVNHPGSQMPQRSFLRSSLAEMRPEIITGMREAAQTAARP